MRVRHGLFPKLLASYIALSLFSMVLLGVFSYVSAASLLRNKILQTSQLALNQIGRNVDFVLGQALTSTSLVMMDSRIEQALIQHYTNGYERIKSNETVESLLGQYTSVSVGNPIQIILVGANGLTATSTQAETSLSPSTLRSLSWFPLMKPTDRRISWVGVRPDYTVGRADKLTLSAAKMLVDPYTGRGYGTLVLQIGVAELGRILPQSIGPKRSVRIVDSSGEIVAGTGNTTPGSRPSATVNRFLSDMTDSKIIRIGGVPTLYLKNRLSFGGLTILERIAIPVLDQEIYALRDHVLFILLIALMVSAACAFFVARRILSPLVQLRNRIAMVSMSGLSGAEIGSDDEAHAIFASYTELVHKLEATVHELVREQREKRSAEIHALQMQINPHFLFNTLKSIKSLVWTNRADRVETVIDSLIRLLEKSIRDTDRLEPLHEQVDLLSEFVRIQEIRLERRLDLSVQIPLQVENCLLPKLILQPLVENSIVHGIESKAGEGKIWLNGSLSGDLVSIEIIDNGVGCEEARIQELLADQTPDSAAGILHHIGLKNVGARLQAVFGRQYRMKIKSQPGVGTSVLLSFPMLQKEALPV